MADTSGAAFRDAGRPDIALPVGRFQALREANERNREFWLEQSGLREQRVADEDVFCVAMNDLRSEVSRHVSSYSQKSFEKALEIAADSKVRFERNAAKSFQSAFSRKGGRAPKTDALQKLILETAGKNPSITEKDLLADFENRKLGPVIVDIDYELGTIDFNNDGQTKSARISGLKDRLFRAKKKIAKQEAK